MFAFSFVICSCLLGTSLLHLCWLGFFNWLLSKRSHNTAKFGRRSWYGLAVPRIFYRTTMATEGHARDLAINPNKMEAFNGVLLEKLKGRWLITDGVVDEFDMIFPWHYDNKCNDRVLVVRRSNNQWETPTKRERYIREVPKRKEQLNKTESQTQYLTRFDNLPTSSGQGRERTYWFNNQL